MADPVLISLAEANDHLRLDLVVVETSPLTFEDDRIPGLLVNMVAAEAIILDYLKVQGDQILTSPPLWTEQDRNVVRAAVLLMLSALWDDAPERTVGDYMKVADQFRPAGTIVLMLARLRDPTLA